ncbi:MAG: hypothetical protein ABII26_12465 [Pseudomonadota bacterium]
MPSLEHLAATLQGRRNLILLSGMARNEAVFFLCIQEYKKKPTKTRAMKIHEYFFEVDSPAYCEGLMGRIGSPALQTWTTTKYNPQVVVPFYKARRMATWYRKLTAGKRKPPVNLFDNFMDGLRFFLPVHLAESDEEVSLMVEAGKGHLLSMSRGEGGGETFVGRETSGIESARLWASVISFAMIKDKQFDPNFLGIANIYSEENLTT